MPGQVLPYTVKIPIDHPGRVAPGNLTPRPSRPGELHPEPLTDSGLEPVPGELLFPAKPQGMSDCYVLSARLMRPYFHPLNVADFKGIHAGYHFGRESASFPPGIR
jgi:hypothetical protein